MKKRLILLLLTGCLVLSLVPAAFAEETTAPVETTAPTEASTEAPREPDQCGDDLRWKFENGTLTISGTGAMDDYVGGAPWAAHKNEIEKLVLSGVTYIGAEAFRDYDKLTAIEFGYHIREIGTRAFYGCDGLESIDLPMSFKIFGEESLRACTNLEEINCDGGFPSFRLNCMWESYVTIYFPADRPWPVSLIQELEEAFHGRIEFIASDGTDPYEPTEPETEATVETVPPTTEAPTEAPTTAPTVPETEVTQPTQEETVPVTESQPAPSEETEPETAPETTAPAEDGEEEEEKERSAWKMVMIGIAAAVVLTVIIALLLIFRQAGRRGKYEY